MEGLIFALVIMALGAFFSGKKKDATETADQARRNLDSAGQRGQRTFKKVEDYAKEVYGDLQTQMKENPQRSKQMVEKAEKVADRLPSKERERAKGAAVRGKQAVDNLPRREPARSPRQPPYSAGRLSAHQEIGAPRIGQEKQAEDAFSLQPEELKKAIVLAEILLPPKSKR